MKSSLKFRVDNLVKTYKIMKSDPEFSIDNLVKTYKKMKSGPKFSIGDHVQTTEDFIKKIEGTVVDVAFDGEIFGIEDAQRIRMELNGYWLESAELNLPQTTYVIPQKGDMVITTEMANDKYRILPFAGIVVKVDPPHKLPCVVGREITVETFNGERMRFNSLELVKLDLWELPETHL